MSWAFQGQRPSGKATTPLGKALPGCLCGTSSQTPLTYLCPLLGSQHPSGGLSAPWRFELIISPCVPVQYGTCPLGMILHINRYGLHGLTSHRDHSNVNHVQSSILLKMCIKPLLPSEVLKDITQICKPSLEEVSGRPIGLVFTGCGMFREKSNPSHVSG
jgi:hypothetical protein